MWWMAGDKQAEGKHEPSGNRPIRRTGASFTHHKQPRLVSLNGDHRPIADASPNTDDSEPLMDRSSLVEFLIDFHRRGNDCAYAKRRGYRTERWSYRQIAETAFRMARELELRSIGKGDHVVLRAENSAEWVVAFFGCALCGVVVVPIDDSSNDDFAQRISQQVDTKLVLCSRRH